MRGLKSACFICLILSCRSHLRTCVAPVPPLNKVIYQFRILAPPSKPSHCQFYSPQYRRAGGCRGRSGVPWISTGCWRTTATAERIQKSNARGWRVLASFDPSHGERDVCLGCPYARLEIVARRVQIVGEFIVARRSPCGLIYRRSSTRLRL